VISEVRGGICPYRCRPRRGSPIWRMILVFASGKLVIVGAKREEQAHEAAEKIRSILM
jgi:TATA-box binding protein (TBP) (component of TFIID and TFIIIB)